MTLVEIGAWYASKGGVPNLDGRPLRVESIEDDGLVRGVYPNGIQTVTFLDQLMERLGASSPGETETCLICGGTKMTRSLTGEPCISQLAEPVPCPNCVNRRQRSTTAVCFRAKAHALSSSLAAPDRPAIPRLGPCRGGNPE
jgi:hypothetical protein